LPFGRVKWAGGHVTVTLLLSETRANVDDQRIQSPQENTAPGKDASPRSFFLHAWHFRGDLGEAPAPRGTVRKSRAWAHGSERPA